ncbi:transcription initiation factor TFIID subunit 12b [Iris pallida]|uniref:Transcription initiation factor TFIID subunit 12b n=1 Tax=Iris pallida TaxID=29817 RepID=A0AAX6HBU0_IRIPA|nr:transcription initiation factor TFIID subunit 12b [Iris pallida]
MAENNPSASPQIPPSPSSLDLPSISSPQLPPIHPQNSNPNPGPSPSNSTLQNLQRAGSMPRLVQLQQQFGAAMAARVGQVGFGGGGIGGQGRIVGGVVGQTGQLPMLPGQSVAQFNNMQTQLMMQPRQKAALVQGMQFNSTNSSGQPLHAMPAMGTMGSHGMNSQLRGNMPLSYGQQRFNNGQTRQQQMSLQTPLTSPQLPGQSLPRGSSLAAMNSQFPGLPQNGQSAFMQNILSQQQQIFKQMQPGMVATASSQHLQQQQQQQQQQQRQQAFSQQQLSTPQLLHQKSIGLNQQQISQLMQMQQPKSLGLNQQQISQLVQQTQLASPRQHQSQQQQLLQQQQQLQHLQLQQLQQQQQSPQMQQGSGFQKSISLTGSQPDTPASVTTITGGNSSQGTEASNQLLGKRKIQDLVSQVDSLGSLDPEVEDLLLEIADNFIDSVTNFACALAKHRKSSTLESKDMLLHLEKNWQLTIPGFTREGQKYQKESLPNDIHGKRLDMVRALMESQKVESHPGVSRGNMKQVNISSSLDRPIKPSASSEQLVLSATASQMLKKVPQF